LIQKGGDLGGKGKQRNQGWFEDCGLVKSWVGKVVDLKSKAAREQADFWWNPYGCAVAAALLVHCRCVTTELS